MKKEQTLQNLKRLLPAALLAGLLGGGLFVFLGSYADMWCWHGIICLNHSIFDISSTLQVFVLCILALFFTGMLAVALQRGEVGSQAQAAFAGGVSGFMAFFVIRVYTRVSNLLWYVGNGGTDPVGYLIDSISYILVNFASTLFAALIMAALAVLGALILFSSLEKAATPEENARASRLVLGSTVLIILVCMIIPPLVARLMIGAGMIRVHSSAALMGTFISLEHTAPDTIVLTAHKVPPAFTLADTHFSVYIDGLDGIDVSNASAAAASGLAVAVEPADGLQAFEGSQATWKGPVFEDNSTPTSVTVIAHGTDGSEIELMVLNRSVLASLN
ncbi:hypothetical protein RJ40_01540 [Methanofollis aquaemaris]|uniref:Uncharacterized protein n=1 Tax=Methanofollis aquaemaris TaxID=126734 RepID=A0A8A3S2X8_9EURY|nr:hypothetical protein [Methanofollis aquaemaris]QSZ66273.1 hypothetical protein RJ40_01540 [Methanofollis aquaemaris]